MSSEEYRANDDLNEELRPEAEDVAEAALVDAEAAEGQPAEANLEEDISLNLKLERAEAQAEDYLESLQRERASFQNYKKRIEAERGAQAERIRGDVLLRLLPVLDDFYRATDAVPDDQRNGWYEGVLLIQRKLERFLEEQGVSEIQALGERFDPNFHEAVGVDTDSDAAPETITEVLQRGYRQKDRVLRPALVRVAP
ncbi:MAG: nucleotide exchange factor GrpE [Anaerolineae bacterium]|nr:nucleotide exchange factor GrpE [Anaerolineae bacterium]